MELDIERHVLSQSKKLSDNTFEKIFSRNDRNEAGIFTYNCHLCAVASLPGEKALQTHITGKKHQKRLVYDYVPNAQEFRTPLVPKPKSKILLSHIMKFLTRSFLVLPFHLSDVPPPGCEEETVVVSYLEQISEKQSKPLIGLEYVVELIDRKAKEPFYICTLCDKKCDPRNITPQITSHRHRMKYLVRKVMNDYDKHFVPSLGLVG